MPRKLFGLLAVLTQSLLCGSAYSASLQVTPVSLEIAPPGATSIITLRNDGKTQIAAQIRVLRWSQTNGVEKLTPTNEVAASPPAVTLQPSGNYAVRVVRLNKTPVSTEESYRLLIDELPDPNRQRNGAISLVVRYSVPVFFASPDSGPPQLTWTIENKGGKISALVRNGGGRHIRLSALKLQDSAGHVVSYGDGLAGYVLAGSTMRLVATQKGAAFGGGQASITAVSDIGPVNANAPVQR